jgi:hypothetical protein
MKIIQLTDQAETFYFNADRILYFRPLYASESSAYLGALTRVVLQYEPFSYIDVKESAEAIVALLKAPIA